MDLVYMHSMFSAWGVKVNEETEVFTDLKTGKPANGRYFNNYPAFMGFGKSDKLQSEGFFDNGKIVEYKIYDKSGNITETDKD